MRAFHYVRLLLLVILMISFYGCQPAIPGKENATPSLPIFTPSKESYPTQASLTDLPTQTETSLYPTVQTLDQILKQPDKYLGIEITVEGILETEGQLPNVRFYLRAPGNERLEVSPWAPLEVMHPPKGEAKPKSMLDYDGLHLRLTGVLRNLEGGWILEVITVKEIP